MNVQVINGFLCSLYNNYDAALTEYYTSKLKFCLMSVALVVCFQLCTYRITDYVAPLQFTDCIDFLKDVNKIFT